MKLYTYLFIFLPFWTHGQINKNLSPQQMKEDLEWYQEINQKANSGLYIYRSKKQWKKLYQEVEQKIAKPISMIEFYKLLTTLSTFEGSCHNYVRLPNDKTDYFPKDQYYFPFTTKWIEGNMVVNNLNQEIPVGSKILTINGIGAQKIRKQFSKYWATDGFNQTQKELHAVEMTFGAHLIMEFGLKENFKIQYCLPYQTKILEKTIPSISLEQRSKLFKNLYSKKYDSILKIGDRKYQLERFNPNTALLTIRSFAIGEDARDIEHQVYAQFLDSLFLEMKQLGVIKNLIIDIRNNGGGSDPNDVLLASYLTNEPFKENREAYTITNQIPFKEYCNLYASEKDSINKAELTKYEKEIKETHNQFKQGKFYQNDSINRIYNPQKNHFNGNLVVLINENVASAASLFAALIKAHSNAIFIGAETTGGYYAHNGHYPVSYKLPNSMITFGFSMVYVAQDVKKIKSQPVGRGILPNYEVKQSLNDFLNNIDTQMEFAKKIIEKNGTK